MKTRDVVALCAVVLVVGWTSVAFGQPTGDAGAKEDAATPEVDEAEREQSRKVAQATRLAQANKYDEAFKLLQEVLKANPKHLAASMRLADVHERKGDKDRALELRKANVTKFPDEAKPIIALAGHYSRAKDHDKAFETLNDGIGKFPKNAGLYIERAQLNRLAAPKKAQADFRRALEIQPDNPTALVSLAVLYIADSEHSKALELLEKAAEAIKGSVTTQFNLGQTYLALGKWDDAVSVYTTLKASRPNDAFSSGGLALAQGWKGEMELAHKALETAPPHPEVSYAKGMLALIAGKPADAVEPLANAVKKAQGRTHFLVAYAEALRLTKKVDEAKKLLESTRDPHSSNGKSFLKAYLALVRQDEGKVDEAQKLMKEALDLQPEYEKPEDMRHLLRMPGDTLAAAKKIAPAARATADPDADKTTDKDAATAPAADAGAGPAASSGCGCSAVGSGLKLPEAAIIAGLLALFVGWRRRPRR